MATARNRAEIERALDRPAATIRCYLLHGGDEAGSRALAARLAAAMGPDADRIDLTPAQLKSDPALLADEAASGSLFGGARHVRVEGAGEDCLAAVEALLTAPAAGNPVVLVAAASLKKDGRLAKRVAGDPAGLTFASYPPQGADLERIATEIARAAGLRIDAGVARRLADFSGADRAILTREIEKLALYADAPPERPVEADHAMLDAIGSDGEGDTSRLLDALFTGDGARLDGELARAAADGVEGITLLRAVLRRAMPMAMARGELDQGGGDGGAAIARAARFVHFSERDAMARDLPRWSGARITALVDRLAALERQLKSSRGPGPVALDHFLFAVARAARR